MTPFKCSSATTILKYHDENENAVPLARRMGLDRDTWELMEQCTCPHLNGAVVVMWMLTCYQNSSH